MYWGVSTRRARLWGRQPRRREGLWKRRRVEKSERRLSHPAWKSRKVRGIPTFPQPRRRLVNLLNRTYHVLQKPDILTCYGQMQRPAHTTTSHYYRKTLQAPEPKCRRPFRSWSAEHHVREALHSIG